MRRHQVTLWTAALALVLPASGRAQVQAKLVQVARCEAAGEISDSLLSQLQGRVLGVYLGRDGRTRLFTAPARSAKGAGVIASVTGSVSYTGAGAAAAPELGLQLRVIDSTGVLAEGHRLTLVPDNGEPLDAGPLNVFQQGTGLEQSLSATIRTEWFARLAGAKSIVLHLGSERLDFTREQRDAIRALYTAAICGPASPL